MKAVSQNIVTMPTETAVYRRSGGQLISKTQMTQDEAIAATPKNHHIVPWERLDVLEKENSEVRRLMVESYVMTGQRGLALDGTYKRLGKGKIKEIPESKYFGLPVEKRMRAWKGSGPVVADFGLNGGDWGLGVDAGRFLGFPAWVVWEPDAPEANAQQHADHDTKLRKLIRELIPPTIAELEPSANRQILVRLKRIQKAAE